MSLPVYLVLTAAEFDRCPALPPKAGYMACHLSPYSTGLSNLPRSLPAGSLLIVNDRIPVCGHDPEVICRQLEQTVPALGCDGILLDFQRPDDPQTAQITEAVVAALPCPVAVTKAYAADLNCPVFLAPPLHIPLEKYLSKWEHREVWLELSLSMQQITVTESGSRLGPLLPVEKADHSFEAENLCCRYYTQVSEDEVRFTLFQTPDCLKTLLKKAETLGVTRAVGLYQELGAIL